MTSESAAAIITRLGLDPHPEGGYYRETFRDSGANGGRGALTVIYYLLPSGTRSAWHRVDAVEVWHFYAGAPLELVIAAETGRAVHFLGTDFAVGQTAHAVVPAGAWQTAVSFDDWTLVGCTVAPAFEFTGFELAPPGWSPPWRNRRKARKTGDESRSDSPI